MKLAIILTVLLGVLEFFDLINIGIWWVLSPLIIWVSLTILTLSVLFIIIMFTIITSDKKQSE